MDSPGDTELNNELKAFSLKGYEYSKMIFYIINEEKELDSNDMDKNNNLKYILSLKLKYKIPLIILLTHSDVYCHKVKKDNENWKKVCESKFKKNKNNLLNWLNEIIEKKFELDDKIKEEEIIHTILIEKKIEISDEDVINSFNEDERLDYESLDEHGKMTMIKMLKRRMERPDEETKFIKEIGVFGRKQLIEKIKKYLPIQYQNALVSLNNN